MMRRRRSQFTYDQIQVQKRRRSVFDLSHGHLTTANMGMLFPALALEVYPYDTFKIKETFMSKTLSALVKPAVGNVFLDRFYFFVPNRILMEEWPQLFGYNPDGPWVNSDSVTVPQVYSPIVADTSGYSMTLGDYLKMMIPGMSYQNVGLSEGQLSALPFLAIGKIWNDFFVSETTGTPVKLTGLSAGNMQMNANAWAPNNIFGQCPNVYKVHDRFTSALPDVQKGDPVTVPLGDYAPVKTAALSVSDVSGNGIPLYWGSTQSSSSIVSSNYLLGVTPMGGGSNDLQTNLYNAVSGATSSVNVQPRNLVADLSEATSATVNDIRYAFATQRILERAARSGTRLVEYIQSTFGVTPSDARLDRAEYLGGRRSPISIQTIAQTSASVEGETDLGDLAGFSNSSGRSGCVKSFTEHGWIICLACFRQYHTYQQGIPRSYMRKSRFDFYDPAFAHIGEQPIFQRELYATADPGNVFGYTEAWNDLRQIPNKISGAVLSTLDNGLDVWHMGDNYANAPVLNDSFLQETKSNFDRVLKMGSSISPQFLVDFWFDIQAVRPMPVRSTPGLLDH